MSKNITRKGIALASGLALGMTGLVSIPASAAAGDVTLSPTSGTTYGVFTTDSFSLDTSVNSLLAADVEDGKLAYTITNPEQIGLAIDMGAGGADAGTVKLTGYTALGAAVVVSAALKVYEDTNDDGDFTDNVATDIDGKFLVDFDYHNITKLVISNIAAGATTKADTWTIEAVDTSATGDATVARFVNTENVTNLAYGDTTYGDVAITIQAGLETDANLTTVENASAVETITFYQPATVNVIATVERFRATGINAAGNGLASALELNDGADDYLTGTVDFTSPVNLNQVVWSNWEVAVDSSTDADDAATAVIDLRTQADTGWDIDDHNFEVVTPAGYFATNLDAAGKAYYRTAVTDDDLTPGATYKTIFRHVGDTTAPFNDYQSPAVEVLATAALATNVEAAISVPADADQTDAQDVTVTLAPGSKTLTYTAQVNDNANAALAVANIPVLAVVTSATYYPAGEVVTLTGTTGRISSIGQTIISASLTDADGQATFTVTSTTAAAGQVINVEFYVLKADDTFDSARANGGAAQTFVNTYATAGASTFVADSTVVASASPTLVFTIEDQFGNASTANAAGAFNVELKAPNTDNLELFAPVAADGTVTFTFDNYLTAGQADVLTAKVYTGTSTNPTYTAFSANVSLYAVTAVTGINVVKSIAGVVVPYADFIVGKTSAAAPGPAAGTTYSGTVIDSNGAGVAGAEVTIAGENMQFLNGTAFSKDSVTLNATAAGTFLVTFWTQTASAAGKNITVTSGAATATTKVTSKVQDGNGALSAANLLFSWSIPAQPVMNTTYAVVATVTDVWGNPIAGASVLFTGLAAANFNAAATATRATGAAGTATVYLRSIKDVDGLAAISAKLTAVNQNGDADPDVDDLATVFTTDVATTSWDETTWTQEVSSEITFTKTASAASAGLQAGEVVNVGTFNGKIVVYAKGMKGETITWKIAGKWVKVLVTEDYQLFDRLTAAMGLQVNVDIHRAGNKTPLLSKTVLTK